VLKSLGVLADDGRAVFIVGGPGTVTGDVIPDERKRAEWYGQGQRGAFWKKLYADYRVIDHFTVEGDLYKKQGAGWPVDIFIIAGKGKSPIRLPTAKAPRILTSWDELKNELGRTDQDRIAAGTLSESEAAELVSGALSGIANITDVDKGPRRPRPRPPAGGSGRPEGGGEPVAGAVRQPSDVSDTGGPAAGGAVAGPSESGKPAGEPVGEHEQRGRLGVEGESYPEPDIAAYRVPYKPKSKHKSFGIFVPTNLELPIRAALDKIEKEVGDTDKYVLEKLGYDAKKEPVEKYFSAEQMDALALAVYAAEKGNADILGDQGGVGKGRVAAGMMEYAI